MLFGVQVGIFQKVKFVRGSPCGCPDPIPSPWLSRW